MVGDTDIEGVVSRVLTHSSDAISQIISGSAPRAQTSDLPSHWDPPGARLGGIASAGDASESAFISSWSVGFCLVGINRRHRAPQRPP